LEEAIASYDKALQIKPDDHEAWLNRGAALRDLGQLEEAIASYDKALQFKPEFYEAWCNRGVAVGNSVSSDQLLASRSSIARQNSALNQRGYDGALASYQEGLKYCHQETHPEGWGSLHHSIGTAHYLRGRNDSRPRPYWQTAINSYEKALITLTKDDFPELHLEVLQDYIKPLLG
jgi:tetratricopeptide (TPR) repeat protein